MTNPREHLRVPIETLTQALMVPLKDAALEHVTVTTHASPENPLDAQVTAVQLDFLRGHRSKPIFHAEISALYKRFFAEVLAAGMPLHLIQFEFRREETGWTSQVAVETPAAHRVISEARAALDQEMSQAMLSAAHDWWNAPGEGIRRLVFSKDFQGSAQFLSLDEEGRTEREVPSQLKKLLKKATGLYAAHGRRLRSASWSVDGYPDDFDLDARMTYVLSFKDEELLARDHEAGGHLTTQEPGPRRTEDAPRPAWTSGLEGFQMSDGVVKAWTRWEEWLRRAAPQLAAKLRGPASDASLRELEDVLRRPLPRELITLWKLHDGQKDTDAHQGLIVGYDFLSVREALTCWRRWDDEALRKLNGEMRSSMTSLPRNHIQRAYTSAGWVPLWREPEQDNFLGVDLDPASKGTSGQVINFGRDEDDKAVHAPSLEGLLEWLATEAEAGRIVSQKHERQEGTLLQPVTLTHVEDSRLPNVLMERARTARCA